MYCELNEIFWTCVQN